MPAFGARGSVAFVERKERRKVRYIDIRANEIEKTRYPIAVSLIQASSERAIGHR